MARRCSREQLGQKVLDLPLSTAVVQVRAAASPSGAVVPHNEQVSTYPPYKGNEPGGAESLPSRPGSLQHTPAIRV
jgi:hypothetical protein